MIILPQCTLQIISSNDSCVNKKNRIVSPLNLFWGGGGSWKRLSARVRYTDPSFSPSNACNGACSSCTYNNIIVVVSSICVVFQRRGRQTEVLRGVVQAGRRGQTVPVHGTQTARPLDVRAAIFVFVRDRARGERQAPSRRRRRRRRTVQQQRWQADVPVAVPERQQRLEIGLHKGAQRVRVHGAVAQEKATTKAEAEERRRLGGGNQRRRRRRQEQVAATVSDDQDDAGYDITAAATAAAAAVIR